MEQYRELKEQVLAFTLQSYGEKLFAGTSGNLSVYDPRQKIMVITPSSIPYEGMTVADIMAVRLDGEIVEGPHRPSSEWRMHAAVYRAHPEIRAQVHTHSPYATSFAVSDETIPVILIEMVPFLGGDVRVARFGLPGTAAVGENALPALENRGACLLQNHGVLAVGATLEQAHLRAVYVEDAARIYHLAKGNGRANALSEEAVRAMQERMKA